MKKIKELRKQLEEVQERMRTEGKDALKEAFVEFFDAHPEVGCIIWTQYTPYFNDGDPCTFDVHEMEFKPAEDYTLPEDVKAIFDKYYEEPYDEYEYGECCLAGTLMSVGGLGWQSGGSRELTAEEKSLVEDTQELQDIPEDLFEMVFGDHVMITANRNGFEVKSYDHD